MNITIEVTDTEYLALEYAAASPQEWVDNAATARANIAIDEIVKIAVEKYLEAGLQIPLTKEEIVAGAFEHGWVQKAAEITE
jgi:hypothetical protein